MFLQAGDPDRARQELEVLAVDDFAGIPFDLAWLQAHTYLAETVTVLGDTTRAEVLYSRLAPFDGLNSCIFDIISNGAVAHHLGLLSGLLGDERRAAAHLRDAVAFNDATGQRPAAARSRMELARVLLRHEDEARGGEVAELVAAAGSEADDLGLAQLSQDLTALTPATSR